MTDLPVTTSSMPPDHSGDEGPDPDQQPSDALTFWQRWGELIVAAGVIAVAIVILLGVQDIRIRQGVVVSPRIFPQIVGIGLLVCGLWYAIDIIRSPNLDLGGGEDDEDVDPAAPTDWTVLGIIAIGLVAYAALMEIAGFIIASAVLFVISAFAMGSRRIVRDMPIALILATGIFLLFNGWLGVRLPGGWLEGLV